MHAWLNRNEREETKERQNEGGSGQEKRRENCEQTVSFDRFLPREIYVSRGCKRKNRGKKVAKGGREKRIAETRDKRSGIGRLNSIEPLSLIERRS